MQKSTHFSYLLNFDIAILCKYRIDIESKLKNDIDAALPLSSRTDVTRTLPPVHVTVCRTGQLYQLFDTINNFKTRLAYYWQNQAIIYDLTAQLHAVHGTGMWRLVEHSDSRFESIRFETRIYSNRFVLYKNRNFDSQLSSFV